MEAYKSLITKANQSDLLKKEVEDIIKKDVQRPLTSIGASNKQALSNILRIYALFNPSVGYCQGMSFIAEFFLVHLKSEPLAFAFFSAVIERYGMSSLFTDGLPLLRRFLYQMDRLVYFQDKNLMIAFLNEGITSAHFSSPWFMSLFTFMLKEDDSEALLPFWDTFLLYGWKAVFRAGIYCVKKLNKKDTDNRELVKELSTGAAIQSNRSEFIEEFKKIPVKSRMLELLNREYNNIQKLGQSTK